MATATPPCGDSRDGRYTAALLRPELIKATMMVGAIDGIAASGPAGSLEDQVGRGGVDALSSAYNNTWFWWENPNSNWANECNNDGTPNDGALTVDIQVTEGNYNALALTWINTGTYTYDHRNDPHPMGTDFDMDIMNVTGPWFFGSTSNFDNPFEFMSFWAPYTQVLRVRIVRTANRDTSARYKLGLVHKFW